MSPEAVRRALRGARWRTSSYSQGANDCVEISTELPGWIGVRDSALGDAGPILAFAAARWRAMLNALSRWF